MKVALIIPCGKRKRKGRYKAEELYIGPYFKAHLQFAKTFFVSDFFIFSAKYGVIPPGMEIQTYDVSFNKAHKCQIDNKVVEKQIKRYLLNKYNFVIVLGGKHYVARLKEIFSKNPNIKISTPLVGLGLGKQIALLTKSVKLKKIIFPIY